MYRINSLPSNFKFDNYLLSTTKIENQNRKKLVDSNGQPKDSMMKDSNCKDSKNGKFNS